MTNLQNLQTAIKVIESIPTDVPLESYYSTVMTELPFFINFSPIEYYIASGTADGTEPRNEEIVSETFWVELTYKLDELIYTVGEDDGIHFEDYFTEELCDQYNMYDSNDSSK